MITINGTERMQIWRENNRERYNKNTRLSARKRSIEISLEIFQILGSKCNNPNCPIPPKRWILDVYRLTTLTVVAIKKENNLVIMTFIKNLFLNNLRLVVKIINYFVHIVIG